MSKKYQEPTIACPSCGVANRISSPFCKECGDRIYKDGAAPIVPENPRRVAKRHAFRSFVNSVIFLALVAVLGLVFWPYSAMDVPRASDSTQQVARYLEEVDRRRDAGLPVPRALISQRNLNAFLGQNSDPDAHKLLGVLLSEDRILLVANEPVGPFHLSTRLVLRPAEGTGGPFLPADLWVGHLPLPTSLVTPWTQQLADRFGLELDPELWEMFRISGVGRNGVVVDVLPQG